MKKTNNTITIDDTYFIEVNAFNFTLMKLAEVTNKRTGETRVDEVMVGHYGTLSTALQRYANEVIRDVGIIGSDVKELIQKIDSLEDFIKQQTPRIVKQIS